MKKDLISIMRFLIPLFIGVVLLYYAFRNIAFEDFLYKLTQTKYAWVLASMVLSLLAYVARAYRWKILLSAADQQVSTFRLTLAVFIGYLANLAFPRLGEITRCAVLKKTNGIPIGLTLGTVVTERIIDALVLLFCILFAFILEFDLIINYFTNVFKTYDINLLGLLYLALGLITIGTVTLLYVYKTESAFTLRLRLLFSEILKGILTVKATKKRMHFMLSTLVLWVTFFETSYMILFALEESSELSLVAGFMLLVTGGVALALPVQGGIGTYHAMVSMMLMLYGIDQTTGLFLATLMHTSQIFAIAIFGGASLLITLSIQKNASVHSK